MTDRPAILGGRPIFDEFVPIVRPVLPPYETLSREIEQIFSSGVLTKGDQLTRFEGAAAAELETDHAVGVASCTVGLLLTYTALGLTGEVVVPSFTFMATVSPLVMLGLSPVFADCDPETANLDPQAAEAAITSRTSAIVAVHNFGNPADIAALVKLAESRGLKLIFDAAHGFGSRYHGSPLGFGGDAQVFSLSPTKLVIAGEGGIVATSDGTLAEKIRMGREYGIGNPYDSAFAGLNGRMPEINALIASHSLGMLEEAAAHRNKLAGIFRSELGRLPGIEFQRIRSNDRSSYKDFSITVNRHELGLSRDALAEALKAENIDTRSYYNPPVHLQSAYRRFHSGGGLENTELLARTSLSLPIRSRDGEDMTFGICEAISRIHKHAREVAAALSKR